MNDLIPNTDPVFLNAQVSIIGSMLIDETCIPPVLAEISADDFPSGPYKSTFQQIKAIFLAGKPVDPLTVHAAMQGGQKYEAFLRECMELTPTAVNVLEYCSILRDCTRMARIRAAAKELADAPDREAQEAILDKLNGLRTDRRVKVVSAADAARDFLERMRARKKPEFLPWGIPGLDRLLEVELGDDIVLGGYSSAGKTLLSVQFAREQAKKYRVGYYSLETSVRKLADRAMAAMSGVPLSAIKNMSYSPSEMGRMAAAANEYAGLHLDHIDGSDLRSVQDIISTALSRRHQIIYIDYLQILVPESGGRSTYERVTDLSLTLHRAAQTHGIAVVLLSQLSRPEKNQGQKVPPTMNSFKESGQIENDADAAMLLYLSDPDDYRSPRILKLAKNKDGPRGVFTLDFDGPTMTMRESAGKKGREVAKQMSAKGRAAKQRAKSQPKEQAQFSELKEDDPNMPF